ncbi:MAG TPA: TIR domain-containing protein [Steroidobacteraceae bacterium]|nr:TIR domain-containing protein [Steroidobacteraceae bacterium]
MSTEEVGAAHPSSESSRAKGAVFLSYASQDGAAAKRICEALRAAGIEVWFDRSELRGGDAWDQSIRRQIKTCALFVPIISQHTHERAEGYFRLEWKLAVDRSHLITPDKAFLVPVVVDETGDDEERVPDKFREVQWTRLPGGETAPEFATRIRKLLSGELVPLSAAPQRPPTVAGRRTLFLPTMFAVALAAVAAYLLVQKPWDARPAATTFTPPPHSVAVLPFVNMSGDKEQEYFSDGLTEEVLNSLSEIDELKVAARTSAFSFKGKDTDIGTIARTLNVGAVLEGSVRRSGNTVRVTTQLINAITGFHLWSHTYDRDLGDVLKLETEIASAVAGALKVSLLGDTAAKIELGGTRNPAAFDAYLRGRTLRSANVNDTFRARIAAFSEAIRLDPNYALAYAWRSLMYSNLPTPDFLNRQEADAREAVRLAPGLAEGYAALGLFFRQTLDFTQARENSERARALAPGSANVLAMSGAFLAGMGQFDEAISVAHRAVALDPLNENSHATLGWALLLGRRYREAIAAFSQAIALNPERDQLYVFRGWTYYLLGDLESARSSCETKRDHWESQGCLAIIYDKLGRHVDSESMLAKMRAKMGNAAAYSYAAIYAQWGNIPKALEWLENAMQLRDRDLEGLKTDPLMDPLRKEPRFQAAMRELKFPD